MNVYIYYETANSYRPDNRIGEGQSCDTCSHYFEYKGHNYCSRLEHFSMMECKENHKFWEQRQYSRDERLIKFCSSCKYDEDGWCIKFDKFCAIASGPKSLGGSGQCISYKFWEPRKSTSIVMGKPYQKVQNPHTEYAKTRNASKKICDTCRNQDISSFTPCKKCIFDGHLYWEKKNAPNKKNVSPRNNLRASSLYDIAFPDDPIRDYFDGVYKRIEIEYKKKEDIFKCESTSKKEDTKEYKDSHKKEISFEEFNNWLKCEKDVSVCFISAYIFMLIFGSLLAFSVSIENGTRFIIDMTLIISSLFMLYTSVSFIIVVFLSNKNVK